MGWTARGAATAAVGEGEETQRGTVLGESSGHGSAPDERFSFWGCSPEGERHGRATYYSGAQANAGWLDQFGKQIRQIRRTRPVTDLKQRKSQNLKRKSCDTNPTYTWPADSSRLVGIWTVLLRARRAGSFMIEEPKGEALPEEVRGEIAAQARTQDLRNGRMGELTAWWKDLGNGRREVTAGRDIDFARLRS
jgi:hypothetical protein